MQRRDGPVIDENYRNKVLKDHYELKQSLHTQAHSSDH